MMSSGANTTHYELGMTRILFSTNHDGPSGMTEGFENCEKVKTRWFTNLVGATIKPFDQQNLGFNSQKTGEIELRFVWTWLIYAYVMAILEFWIILDVWQGWIGGIPNNCCGNCVWWMVDGLQSLLLSAIINRSRNLWSRNLCSFIPWISLVSMVILQGWPWRCIAWHSSLIPIDHDMLAGAPLDELFMVRAHRIIDMFLSKNRVPLRMNHHFSYENCTLQILRWIGCVHADFLPLSGGKLRKSSRFDAGALCFNQAP